VNLEEACKLAAAERNVNSDALQSALLCAEEGAARRLCHRLETCICGEKLLPRGSTIRWNSDLGHFEATTAHEASAEQDQEHQPEVLTFKDLSSVSRWCCSLCPGAEDQQNVVVAEFEHTYEQEAFSLLYRDSVFLPSITTGSISEVTDAVWSKALSLKGEDQLVFFEQVAAFIGHPLHPMAKSRLPLTPSEAFPVAPEFGPEVEMKALAVDKSLMEVFPSVEEWQQQLRNSWPAAATLLDASDAVKKLGGGDAYIILPVHPLNEERMKEWYAKEFAADRMIFLNGENSKLFCRPSLSLRTVVPPQGTFKGLRIKVPVPVHATSLPRYVSPVEVKGSSLLSTALPKVPLPKELVWLPESFGVHLKFSGEPGDYTYEQARFCSTLLRKSPATVLEGASAGSLLIPLAALFARPAADDGPCLWKNLWRHFEVLDGQSWWNHYIDVMLKAHFGIFLSFGVALEAHQQNSFLQFGPDGQLQRLVYQEMGGGVFWDKTRLLQLPVDFTQEVYARDDILQTSNKCLACVRHTLLRCHLAPLMDEVAAFFQIGKEILRASIVSSIETLTQNAIQMEGDQMSPADFKAIKEELSKGFLGPGERKALLRMRLQQSKDELYVDYAPEI